MKTRIIGIALVLGLGTALGACDGGGETPSTSATTSPAEPTDTGATPAGGSTATTPASTASPTATGTASPKATKSP